MTSGCHRLRQANKQPRRYLPSPCALPYLATPWLATSRLPFPPRPPFPGAPGRTRKPSRPPCHRLAPTALCWRSPRQLGVRRSSTPETRRPALPPRPLGPSQAQQPVPSRCAVAPLGLPRLPTEPRCGSPPPTPPAAPAGSSVQFSSRGPVNLLFTGTRRSLVGFTSTFLQFPFCRSLTPEGKGWPPADRWIGSRVGYGEGRRSNFSKSPRAEGGAGLRGQAGVSRSAEAAGAG